MDITIADEQAWLIKEQLTMDHAEGRAWSKKTDAFGTVAKVTSFLQRPKDDEFELIYKEHRYEPFWHIVCTARYIYERDRQYQLTVGGPMVEKVTLNEIEFIPKRSTVTLSGVEHCREENHEKVFIEGVTGQSKPELEKYFKFEKTEIPKDDLDEFAPEGVVVVPPKTKASTIVHEVLTSMIKSLDADRIIEDSITVETVDLYYHPVYAFQYSWLTKEKEAVMEYDGLTGELRADGQIFRQYMGKMIDPEFLFDIGVETVDLLVPGGGIAIKLARKGLGAAKAKKN